MFGLARFNAAVNRSIFVVETVEDYDVDVAWRGDCAITVEYYVCTSYSL